MKFLIMAGGGGTRLWPVSRKNKPKQILPFIGNRTLLQATVDRLLKRFELKDIYISTNAGQLNIILEQLPNFLSENIICEPIKKDTAPAIGFAALHLLKNDPQESFITINSDAYFQNVEEYLRILQQVEILIAKYPQKTILVGVKPTYPETGYGYIKIKDQFDKLDKSTGGFDDVFEVESFIEKPDLETAKKYIEKGDYLWNPALFIFKLETFFNLYQNFLPRNYDLLMQMKDKLSDIDFVNEKFSQMQAISIDYGLMEKIPEMLVVPADFGWRDIGSWQAIKDVLSNDQGNLIYGEVVEQDCEGNLIYNYSDRLVTVLGIKNSIIVQTNDVTFICPKEKSQDVKKIITLLKEQNKEHYL